MELVQLRGPEITFNPNRKLEVIKNAMLIIYVVLEVLYKTIVGMYLAVEMERLQCVIGAVLACLLLVEWFRLDKENKINWIKRHAIVFVYFAIRVMTFVSIGFKYTMLRSVFFEGIYLLVITELVLNSKLCKTVVIKLFIVINLVLNILNTVVYWYCEYVFAYGDYHTDFLHGVAMEYTHVGDYWCYYTGMYSNPNQIGLMTGLAILLAISYLHKELSSGKRICMAIYFVFSLYCVLYSKCSNAHIALLAAAMAFIIVCKFKLFTPKRIIITCLACCILATGCMYYIAGSNSPNEPYTAFEEKLNSLSTNRYTIWKDSYYSHQEELLLGCGNMTLEKRDRYQYNLDKGNDLGFDINGSLIEFVGPHNGYIGTISCAGLLGFAAFVALLLKKINDSKSLEQRYWYLAVVFILVVNLFECMMPISKNFVTLFMFLILAMDDREETA